MMRLHLVEYLPTLKWGRWGGDYRFFLGDAGYFVSDAEGFAMMRLDLVDHAIDNRSKPRHAT